MVTTQSPHNLILMDDDFFAMLWAFYQLSRDIRTRVLAVYQTPEELKDALRGLINPDAILLDTEYHDQEPGLADLIDVIRSLRPNATIICLSQYGETGNIHAAVRAGANGFLIKGEIGLSLVTAVTQACQGDFVTTPGAFEAVRRELPSRFVNIHCLPRWERNPELSPQVEASFWLRILFGMRAAMAAEELGVATGTVEKYVSLAYQKLVSEYDDEIYMNNLDVSGIPPEERAFLFYTMPPKAKRK